MLSKEEALRCLLEEKLVALPTETVFGLAGLASSEKAIASIYQVKQRPRDNPLIAHIAAYDQILPFVKEVPAYVKVLFDKFTPGPLSFMLRLKEGNFLQAITCGQPTIIFRIPDHPLTLEILQALAQPVACPSANISGKVSATTAEMVKESLGDKIAGVLQAKACRVGVESSIIDCTQTSKITFLRTGSVGKKELQTVLLASGYQIPVFEAKQFTPVIPGDRYRHYAPDTPVEWYEGNIIYQGEGIMGSEEGLTSIDPRLIMGGKKILLGSLENLPDMAHKLYKNLWELDKKSLVKVYLVREDYGSESLARAISNRLSKVIEN